MRIALTGMIVALALVLIYIGLSQDTGLATENHESLPTLAEPVVMQQPEPATEEELHYLLTSKLIAEPFNGDFSEMRERRMIRVLVTHSRTFYFFDGPEQRGLTYESMRNFEKYINRKFKTGSLPINVVFIPVSRDQLIPALLNGRGDIAAANLTMTEERLQRVDFSVPSLSDISEILVSGPGAREYHELQDLSGRQIHVRRSSSYFQSLQTLNEQLRALDRDPVKITDVDENLEDEDLLEMVDAGLIPAVIVDSHKAHFWSKIFKNLTLHEDITLRTDANIGWAFRKDSPELAELINSFVRKNREGTLTGNILLTRYLSDTRYMRNALAAEELQKFDDTIELFQKYADKYQFDWLMIVSQAYQESRLDQSARSHTGAVGIMQVLPTTAADKNVNVKDIHKLENNIHAGSKYLRFLRDRYFDNEDMNEMNKTLFSFAAYNAGPARVARLRREAEQQGLDPNLWFGNVEVIAAKRIGRETVQYVSNIYKYWVAYKLTLENHAEHLPLRNSET